MARATVATTNKSCEMCARFSVIRPKKGAENNYICAARRSMRIQIFARAGVVGLVLVHVHGGDPLGDVAVAAVVARVAADI